MEITSYKSIWKVAYPIIAGSVAQNIINVVDTAFLGRLGTNELGAAGNSIIFYFMFMVLGLGFAIGSEIIVGRRNGEKKYDEIGRIVDHSFYVLLPLSVLLFVFLAVFSSEILAGVTSNPEILSMSVEYMDMRKYGIFFAFTNLAFRTFYVGTIQTAILSWSTGLMAIVNTVLDYLLIFGHFGFPEMGVEGAALASVIAEASATIYFIIYTYVKTDRMKYGLLFFKKANKAVIKNILSISSPIMLQNFAAITSWMFFFLIIEKIGSRELAVSHIIRSIYMVLMIPLFGFAAATSSLVSNLIGMGRTDEVPKMVKRIVILTLGITSVIIPFNLLLPEQMISIYTSDLTIINQAIPVLYVITGSMLFFAVSFILFSAVSGTGNTRTSLLIELSTLIIYISAAYWLGVILKANLAVVWCSEFIYFSVMGLLAMLYFKYGNWRLKKI